MFAEKEVERSKIIKEELERYAIQPTQERLISGTLTLFYYWYYFYLIIPTKIIADF